MAHPFMNPNPDEPCKGIVFIHPDGTPMTYMLQPDTNVSMLAIAFWAGGDGHTAEQIVRDDYADVLSMIEADGA